MDLPLGGPIYTLPPLLSVRSENLELPKFDQKTNARAQRIHPRAIIAMPLPSMLPHFNARAVNSRGHWTSVILLMWPMWSKNS